MVRGSVRSIAVPFALSALLTVAPAACTKSESKKQEKPVEPTLAAGPQSAPKSHGGGAAAPESPKGASPDEAAPAEPALSPEEQKARFLERSAGRVEELTRRLAASDDEAKTLGGAATDKWAQAKPDLAGKLEAARRDLDAMKSAPAEQVRTLRSSIRTNLHAVEQALDVLDTASSAAGGKPPAGAPHARPAPNPAQPGDVTSSET